MRIEVVYDGDRVHIYHNEERLGHTSYEAFCLLVLSPRQFRRLEKDPERSVWDVRKICLSHALAEPTWSASEQLAGAWYSLPQVP